MADEKLNNENVDAAQMAENVKEAAGAARDALKEAAVALHGLNRTLQDEAYKGAKAVVGKAADVATDMAEIADPLTRGAASRVNEATMKAADAAGEAMDKAYALATEAYDKAFDAASKLGEKKDATEQPVEADAAENGAE